MTNRSTASSELVPMAGIGVSQGTGTLRTLLGSCIGVALYERRLKLLGLAHVVMPDSKGVETALGKYADTAIPETIRRMQALVGSQRLTLTAKIAGGANMFAHVNQLNPSSIGEQNMAAVERVLKSFEIPILARHVGGTAGRRMLIEVSTGVVQIQVVGHALVVI